jgi:hypothetical protein
MLGMAIIENKKIYGISVDDIKKQSTSWLKGVKRVLAGLKESGEEVPDLEAISNEVDLELEKRLTAGATPDTQVTQTEPEKMRDVR